ncbi:hypothetical protein [Brevibacillus parabrevis]|uniref:hypothetical protein n=1 Tax=Brevibacillus parabrevis TaxID=54914 RepID=UPI001F61CCD8|nr:hypothetical protein [Brevibacillus parabrevis]MDR4998978.1 hypothetical protein [Brevibacillus parabrevis]
MSDKQQKLNVKKRLMFNKEEDYYFITYNVLVFLNTLGCTSEKKKFTDYTKLAYIIPFVSNNGLLDIVVKYNLLQRQPSKEETEILRDTYIKSRLRLKLLTSIFFALEHNQIIGLKKNDRRSCIDIWINKDKIPKMFLHASIFKIEKENSLRIKNEIQYLTSLSVKKLLESLYTSKGVRVWEV